VSKALTTTPGWCDPRVKIASPRLLTFGASWGASPTSLMPWKQLQCLCKVIKRVDHVAHRLAARADARGDLADALAHGARPHDLRPAQDEGIGRAHSVLQGTALGVRYGTHIDRMGVMRTHSIPCFKLTPRRKH